MKKRILSILLVVLTLASLICAFSFAAGAEGEAPTVTVDKFNLVFADNVYLKYAVKFEGVEDSKITSDNIGMLYFTEPKVDYTKGGEASSAKVTGYTTIDGTKYYTFEYRNLTAKQMTDYIYSVAYIDLDGERYFSAPVKYSVLDYAYAKLGKTGVGTNDENLKNMLVSMLEYGANAQKYFKYNTERLANKDYYSVRVVGGTLADGFTKGLYHNTETLTLTANKSEGFVGWKNNAGEIISNFNPLILTNVTYNDTYTAVYEEIVTPDEPEVEEEIYTRDGDYIYFGEYPQTIKEDGVTTVAVADERGYYLGSDGYYYAKVVETPYDDDYAFSTGETVTNGEVYYFKVEPIRWRILATDEETAFILCDSIIANHRYDDSWNNYKNSEIRAWLNDQFYNTAFNELQREIILTTTVDNSVASTGYSSNPYACEDTEDKIFLLSYAEVTNSAYGFSSYYRDDDIARKMKTSDYTRATGAYMNTSSSYYGNGDWLLRSLNAGSSSDARYVSEDGNVVNSIYVGNASSGVVPALQIRLDNNVQNPETPDESEVEEELYTRDGDYIYFGEYPQTIKADDVTITEIQDSRGYYLGSDRNYYAKVVKTPCYDEDYDDDYAFSTGEIPTSGEVYYFKVEPIRWRILATDEETAFILCDSIIADKAFNDDYSNNYAESEIRAWLNDQFYNTAFNELQREIILTTTVDNSAASTGYSSNPYVCEDTEDKIFLLSYAEATNSAYGFSSDYSDYDTARRMQTSDYTRATGAYMNTSSSYYGNGYWWLRSPFDYSRNARRVNYYGEINNGSFGNVNVSSSYGVVPALQIRL